MVIMADLCLLQALDAAQAINSIEAINNIINNPHPGRIIVDYDNPFEGLTDKDFKDRFCFTKPRVLYLCELLHTYLERPTARSKAFPVPLKFCLLWKQESYQCGRKGSRTGGGGGHSNGKRGYQACPWTHKKHPNHVFFRYENRPYIRFFLNLPDMSFPKCVYMTKNTPFFSQFCTFLHP